MDWSPVWAPDGERVYFVTARGGGIVSWKGADNNQQGDVLPGWRGPHSISPDGAFLAYYETSPETGQDIGILTLGEESLSPRTLFATPFTEENPAISPDGRWIAYSSTESGRSEVYVTPFPDVDRNRWQVSVNGGYDPTWAPNGGELFFVGNNAMMSVGIIDAGESLQFSEPEVLFEGDFVWSSSHARQYDVAPDGQRFLMMKPEEGSPQRINIVLNWAQELERLVPTGS
jgi:serine/threonine-protein kinase